MIDNSRKIKIMIGALLIVGITVFTTAYFTAIKSDKHINIQGYLSEHALRQDGDAVTPAQGNKALIAEITNLWEGKQSQKKEDTVVAVIDTLVDWTHEDLKGKAWTNAGEIPNDGYDNDNNGYIDDYYGYNFLDGKGISTIKNKSPGAHGTAITGVICATMNNGVGVAGIAGLANVKVMNLAVLDSITTEGKVSNLIAAIEYAEKNGAKICNISSNYLEEDIALLSTLEQSKMLFVVSAGNRPTLGVNLDRVVNVPANYNFSNVITVSAYTKKYRILRQANYGPNTVDILAPGEDILAPIPDNQYAYFSGTSISTPIVTGLAALLDQSKTEITATQIRNQILSLVSYNDDFACKIKDGAYLRLSDILIK